MDDYQKRLEALSMRTYDELGNRITEWDNDAGWMESGTEVNEYGDHIMNQIYHPYTDAEIKEISIRKEQEALAETRRQLTAPEVMELFIRSQINMVSIDDRISLRMMDYYPKFEECLGITVNQGFKFVYNDKLYKTIQPEMIMLSHYPPGLWTESLYTRIDVEHTGKIYDPIPYDGNMELFKGLYYIQDDTLYLCNRDTGTAVYQPLGDLVGICVLETKARS